MQIRSRYVTAASARRNPAVLYRVRDGCIIERASYRMFRGPPGPSHGLRAATVRERGLVEPRAAPAPLRSRLYFCGRAAFNRALARRSAQYLGNIDTEFASAYTHRNPCCG